MTIHPFDQALQLTPAEPGVYTGASSNAYWNMVGPFGGTSAATARNALPSGRLMSTMAWINHYDRRFVQGSLPLDFGKQHDRPFD